MVKTRTYERETKAKPREHQIDATSSSCLLLILIPLLPRPHPRLSHIGDLVLVVLTLIHRPMHHHRLWLHGHVHMRLCMRNRRRRSDRCNGGRRGRRGRQGEVPLQLDPGRPCRCPLLVQLVLMSPVKTTNNLLASFLLGRTELGHLFLVGRVEDELRPAEKHDM